MSVRLRKQAVGLAAAAHKGQLRKFSGGPYLRHPIEVAALVERNHGSAEQALAAILHDVVEDSDIYDLEDIRLLFGDVVASIVDGMTRRSDETHRESVLRASRTPGCWLVKKCDILHNLSTLPPGHSLHARYIDALRVLHDNVPDDIRWREVERP